MRCDGLPSPDGRLLVLPSGDSERADRGAPRGGQHEARGGTRVAGRLREEMEVVWQRLVQFFIVGKLYVCGHGA